MAALKKASDEFETLYLNYVREVSKRCRIPKSMENKLLNAAHKNGK